MKGIFLKDFYTMKSSLILIFIMCIILIIPTPIIENCTTLNATGVIPLIILFSSMTICLTMATTIIDDKNSKWMKFLFITPVSKKEIIDSKYIEYLLCGIGGILVPYIIGIVIIFLNPSLLVTVEYMLQFVGISFILVFLCGSIILPSALILYKNKSILSSLIIFITTFLSLIISGVLVYLVNLILSNMKLEIDIYSAVISASCVISFLCYMLSWIMLRNKYKL